MRFCQGHWDRLREAIKQRGLDALVPDSGERAAEQFVRAAEGEDTVDTFDPLMYAHWAIVSHGMDLIGLAIMMDNEDGSGRCPLCFLNTEHERTCLGCQLPKVNGFDSWIDKAADAAKGHWELLAKGVGNDG